MAIRWIKDAKLTGLASIGAMPRGASLTDTKMDRVYVFVSAESSSGDSWSRKWDVWRFWLVTPGSLNRHSKNTFETFDIAKEKATQYFNAHREKIMKMWEDSDARHAADKEAKEAAELERVRKLGGVNNGGPSKKVS